MDSESSSVTWLRPSVSASLACAVLVAAAAASPARPAAAAAPPERQPPAAKAVPGAGNDLDVAYLPPARLSGTADDALVRMNVHWPAGGDPGARHPCVVIVHGGGYGAGDKDEAVHQNLAAHCVRNGFVAVNLNYILGDEIFPQVFWDLKAAALFLRKNAEPVYKEPVTVDGTTTVKAVAVRTGRRPSGPATAVFIADPAAVPPAIIGPAALPRGKVGEPYAAELAAEGAAGATEPVRWHVDGQHRNAGGPNAPRADKGFANYVGLAIDPGTGRLRGTPKRAGAFVLQVQAAHGMGQVADGRTYLLVVDP